MKFLLVEPIKYLNVRLLTYIFTTILIMLSALLLQASEIPQRPDPPRLVNDFTGTLNRAQVNRLEEKLVHYNDTTSTQLVVVLVADIGMRAAAEYAFAIGESWGVGQRGQNNGAVILVQPKGATGRGHAYIATGYGLEGVIPDALAKRIVENEMIPLFRQNDYYNGINNAIDVMVALAAGEYTADEYQSRSSNEVPAAWFVPLFVFLIIFFMIRASKSANHIGNKSSLPFWTAIWLAGQASRSHSGSWKGFSGGSGFGGRGGGFGGFGGGSFGGGGAGGSW
jgi:uncharacterized protein